MQDGFYKIRLQNKLTFGELLTDESDIQWLYLIGFDEAMNPSDFDIQNRLSMNFIDSNMTFEIKKGFYKLIVQGKLTIGEIRIEDEKPVLYIVGFDMSMSPDEFEFISHIYVGEFK